MDPGDRSHHYCGVWIYSISLESLFYYVDLCNVDIIHKKSIQIAFDDTSSVKKPDLNFIICLVKLLIFYK